MAQLKVETAKVPVSKVSRSKVNRTEKPDHDLSILVANHGREMTFHGVTYTFQPIQWRKFYQVIPFLDKYTNLLAQGIRSGDSVIVLIVNAMCLQDEAGDYAFPSDATRLITLGFPELSADDIDDLPFDFVLELLWVVVESVWGFFIRKTQNLVPPVNEVP